MPLNKTGLFFFVCVFFFFFNFAEVNFVVVFFFFFFLLFGGALRFNLGKKRIQNQSQTDNAPILIQKGFFNLQNLMSV